MNKKTKKILIAVSAFLALPNLAGFMAIEPGGQTYFEVSTTILAGELLFIFSISPLCILYYLLVYKPENKTKSVERKLS